MSDPPLQKVFTNAHPSWPAVDAGTLREYDPGNLERLRSTLQAGLGCEVECDRLVFFGGRVFTVPLVVRLQAGQEVPVFLYDNHVPEGAGWRFSQESEVSRRLGFRDPVFYALCEVPTMPAPSEDPIVLSTYNPMLFRLDRGDLSKRDYALWWPGVPGLRFPESPCFEFHDKIVTALDGFVTYYWTHTLRRLDLNPRYESRIVFGDGIQGVRVRGPDGAYLAVTADKDTGLLFHFDRGTTTEPARREILRQLSETVPATCKEIPSWFTRTRFKKDGNEYRQGLHWWRELIESLRVAETPPDVIRPVDFGRVEFLEPPASP
jgi:hypothetical protein